MHLLKGRERIYTFKKAMPELRVACVFQAEVYRSDGTIRYKGPKFNNTILDVGLDRMFNDSRAWNAITQRCNVGTGTTSPSTGQTGLHTYVANTNTVYSASWGRQQDAPMHVWYERTFAFAIGFCADNTNLTEIGLSFAANAQYFNRQLFRDEENNPTTITVHSDEGLRVSATLYIYFDMAFEESIQSSFDLTLPDSTIQTVTFNKINNAHLENNAGFLSNFSGPDNIRAYQFNPRQTRIGLKQSSTVHTAGNVLSMRCDGGTSFSYPRGVSFEEYTSGSFNAKGTVTWPPGVFDYDANAEAKIYWAILGRYRNAYASQAYYIIDLVEPITVRDVDELVLNIETSWGRYTP